MKKKKLKKKINELENTLKHQETLIESQEILIGALRANIPNHYPNIPSVWQDQDVCTDGKAHEYPMPWHSVTSPHCTKCGKQSPNFDITFTTTSDNTNDVNFNNLNNLNKK
jgi:hypothetical protein